MAVHCGVHGRVATRMARIARKSGARVAIRTVDKEIECSSILEILALGISRGSRIRVRVNGHAPEQILAQVCSLLTGEAL